MQRIRKTILLLMAAGSLLIPVQCTRVSPSEPEPAPEREVIVEVNAAFELFNIAIALMPSIRDDANYVGRSEYHHEVIENFKPFSESTLIGMLEYYLQFINPDRNSIKEIALLCEFRNGGLNLLPDAAGLIPAEVMPFLTQLIAAAGQFAEDSGFQTFFDAHTETYRNRVNYYRECVDVDSMWIWLENRFPARYSLYYIPLSPLTGGSHFTQRAEIEKRPSAVMVVSGPDHRVTDPVEAGDYARILFTEIDHNYVNPVSDSYSEEINRTITNLDDWNRQEGYRSAYAVFNEYMTWAVFSLYAREHYNETVFRAVDANAAELMTQYRKFIRYELFRSRLLAIYPDPSRGESVADYYPGMLTWMQAETSVTD